MINVWIPQLTRGDVNIKTPTCIGAAAFGLAVTATTAFAEDCTALTVEDRFELEGKDVVALYHCLSDKLSAGYAKEGAEVGANFRSWAPPATPNTAPPCPIISIS